MRIQLHNGEETIVSIEWFDRLSSHRWFKAAGGYVARKEHGRNIYMARFIMSAPAHLVVDHIDGNKLNNQVSNLRICTRQENLCNRGAQSNNKSGFKGIVWQKRIKRWQVRVCANKVNEYIGVFVSKRDAIIAHNSAAKRLHGEFAYLYEVPADEA